MFTGLNTHEDYFRGINNHRWLIIWPILLSVGLAWWVYQSIAYGVALSPSYQFQAQSLLTNIVSFSVTQQTPTPELVGVVSINYGRGDEIGSNSVNAVSYTSYAATGGVLYKFTPQTFLNLTYLYANYDNQFGATNNSFDRHVVSINLAQAFY